MIRLTSLIAALSLAVPAVSSAQPGETGVPLAVPYVPQTAALCGGAAVAMVFRYWGDTRADAQQFAPLIDRRAGGIAEDTLMAAVVERGWRVATFEGSIGLLREQIDRGRPVVILLEDRPSKYHYLVVTSAGTGGIVVHDPSWGPSRTLTADALMQAWAPARFWSLVITPSTEIGTAAPGTSTPRSVAPWHRGTLGTIASGADECPALLDAAVSRIRSDGLETADEALGAVTERCSDSAAPLRELAGVRFAQKRWREAETLAAQAVERDPADSYAWDVLASSRFVQDDYDGALRAWNRIGQPRLDTIDITGLTRARYEAIAQTLGLAPHALLTPEAFARAVRRVDALPDRTSSRVSFRPAEDGYASVDVALVERPMRPKGAAQWSMTTAKSLVDREVGVTVPGLAGQGDVWSASWRWWPGRPRVAMAFTAPRAGRMTGIYRADGSWESQRYASSNGLIVATETRGHAGFTMSDWATGTLRVSVGGAFDEWNHERRSASATFALERSLADDRLELATDAIVAAPLGPGETYQSVGIRANSRLSTSDGRWQSLLNAGAAAVSAHAPLALWPGAGDGHARPMLLRAHSLIDDGVIGGEAFGRRLVHASAEAQGWWQAGVPARVGIAAFVDAAQASRGFDSGTGGLQIDAGIGVRLKVLGSGGVLRVDVARGLRDGAVALTAGWLVVR